MVATQLGGRWACVTMSAVLTQQYLSYRVNECTVCDLTDSNTTEGGAYDSCICSRNLASPRTPLKNSSSSASSASPDMMVEPDGILVSPCHTEVPRGCDISLAVFEITDFDSSASAQSECFPQGGSKRTPWQHRRVRRREVGAG